MRLPTEWPTQADINILQRATPMWSQIILSGQRNLSDSPILDVLSIKRSSFLLG